jgi:hypothetical protein
MAAERSTRIAAGIGALPLALVLVTVRPHEALTGWLGAAVFFQSLPLSALILLLMMRLIPGAWDPALRPQCEASLALVVPAALAFVPVLAFMAFLYPWVDSRPDGAFKAAWLSPLFFVARTLAWFALLGFLSWRARSGRPSAALASAGLIAITLLGSLVMVDWLMSLTPDFASSGFGIQLIGLSFAAGLAALVIAAPAPASGAVDGILGGLLLTALLLWAYFQFLTYFIIWSGNLAPGADWYAARSDAGWLLALLAFSLLGGIPLLALLLPFIRTSRRALVFLSILVIAGKAIEFAWFAIPPEGLLAILAFVLAAGGLVAIAAVRLAPLRKDRTS